MPGTASLRRIRRAHSADDDPPPVALHPRMTEPRRIRGFLAVRATASPLRAIERDDRIAMRGDVFAVQLVADNCAPHRPGGEFGDAFRLANRVLFRIGPAHEILAP